MVEIQLNTPLAEALNMAIQPKLGELGFGSGGADDTALAEYVVLMLVNGKTQDEINNELSTDFLGLPSDDPSVREFVRWLFEQINILSAQYNGTVAAASAPAATNDSAMEGAQEDYAMDGNLDSSMTDSSNEINAYVHMPLFDATMPICKVLTEINRPTGPKSMRGDNNFRGGREKRMMGQINRALDRNLEPPVLHRTRGQNGVGRTPPSGPRMGAGRQPRVANNRAASIAAGINAHGMPGMPPVGPKTGMGMNGMNRMNPGMNQGWGMAPQQPTPADLMAMVEQQQMMIQMLAQSQGQGPMMPNGAPPYGRPLSERVQKPYQNNFRGRGGAPYQPNGHHHNKPHFNGQTPNQASDSIKIDVSSGSDEQDVDMSQGQAKHDTSVEETMCHYNLRCSNAECKFAHQSPAAPPGITVDVSDVCSFGAACKNRKCVGRHPSPAKKMSHMGETDCKFFPNCTNPHCPFRHPSMPPCRNGGECKVPNCKFTHVKTACKFHPCTNRFCPFSHEEGQRGTFPDKVWKADGSKEHVSDRKFVDDQTPETVILPDGGGDKEMNGTGNGVSEPHDVVV
jgi:hypothetical protein